VNQLFERLKRDFGKPNTEEARYSYAETFLNAFVSAQIKTLREDRELSQEEAAELIGTKQSGISRLESVNYSSWKVDTLRKIARAFGVRLRISFEEFGTLPEEVARFNRESLGRHPFHKDPVFSKPQVTKGESDRLTRLALSVQERGEVRSAQEAAEPVEARPFSQHKSSAKRAGDQIPEPPRRLGPYREPAQVQEFIRGNRQSNYRQSRSAI
jgi:transcriptional regulator with XRE-family HTH domain